MQAKQQEIEHECAAIIEKLMREKNQVNYEKRWNELQDFREKISAYVNGYSKDDYSRLSSKVTILSNGHLIDHHALGYFAPMEFQRYGFTDTETGKRIKRSPVDQLRMLSNHLKLHGIRFIYVPLPCKTAVNPLIISNENVIPKDEMVIPQWRSMILNAALAGIEVIDCYSVLKGKNDSYTKNHHVSPVGADIIGKEVAKYIKNTTIYSKNHSFIQKKEIIGSPVLYRSGDANSIELDVGFYEANRTLVNSENKFVPYVGKDIGTDIAVIGDCNLQSYRGTGFDITAQISGYLQYPVLYVGRYLPFAKNDSIEKLPEHSLAGIDVLLYIGFVSGCFVRACHDDDVWCQSLPSESVFS